MLLVQFLSVFVCFIIMIAKTDVLCCTCNTHHVYHFLFPISTWTSFSPTSTTMSDPFAPLPLAGEIGSSKIDDPPSLPVLPPTSTTTSFDMSAFNVPLDSITMDNNANDKVLCY